MPIALLVLFVLTLLGTVLWQYFMTDTMQVARAEEMTQAYYLARSGVEVGLGNLENVLYNSVSTITSIDELETKLTYIPSISAVDTGTFDVNYEVDKTNSSVKIISNGTAAEVTQKEAAIVNFHFPALNLNPPQWLNNGYIVNTNDKNPSDQTGNIAQVSNKENVGHAIKHTSGLTDLYASFIAFIDAAPSLEIGNNATLHLHAGIVSFYDSIYLSDHTKSLLYLHPNLKDSAKHRFIVNSSASAGPHTYSTSIRIKFSGSDFTIDGVQTNTFVSNEYVGIVYFGGDVKESHGNSWNTILNVNNKYD